MIIQRLYSKPENGDKKKAPKETTPRVKKTAPKIKEVEKTGAEKFITGLKEKGKEILKNPKTKKWGLIGTGALGGTMAIEGIDAGVKKVKEKKKEKEAKEQILKGLKK